VIPLVKYASAILNEARKSAASIEKPRFYFAIAYANTLSTLPDRAPSAT